MDPLEDVGPVASCGHTELRPRHPRHLQRRFLDTPGEIISDSTGVTVKINRRAYSPVLRHASLPADTTVPWWNGRQLRFEFA